MASSDQIPAIRTSQFDGGGIGATASSVNLFRGDVNYVHSLFSMPGRGTDQSMAVQVSLLYQSNVTLAGTTWNRDAPTSVVGLGWTLPLMYIELTDQGSPTPGLWSYTYWANGTATPLIAEPTPPFLFSMSSSLATELKDGEPVPDDIRAAFAAHGIALGANATVTAPPSGSTSWTLTDDDGQQLFSLAAGTSSLDAFDGGQSFQLQSYKFWKILYYAPYERWVVKTESGQTQSFGGIGTPTPNKHYATAEGNSIAWGVRWASSSGVALWSGPSALAPDQQQQGQQQQYARSWYLARAINIWGDAIVYGYNEWTRDATTDLIPDVEQQVGIQAGASGLPYTKACYLTSITDVFGRKAVFNYEDKQWSDSSDESPREYADPHKAKPDTTPNAYQDCYETKYLDSVDVYGTGQTTLFTIALSYEVKNVNDYTGTLNGDTFKRYLIGTAADNADGKALPGTIFQYYLDDTGTGASPGALASITYPEGGTATYSYTKQSLAACDRSVTVSPPKAVGEGATPRVWFGPDYAVTTWYQPSEGRLSLVVYTWLGRWVAWQIGSDALLFENPLDSLDVLVQDDFFAVNVETEHDLQVYIFRKDVARPGQWVPASLDGNTTAKNPPTLTYDTGTYGVTLQAGDNFLVAALTKPADSSGYYQSINWNWTKNTWEQQPEVELSTSVQIAAFAEYYLVLDSKGNATVNYLDPSLNWHSEQCNFKNLAGDLTYVALVPGSSFVAVSRLQSSPKSSETTYELTIIQWGADYQLAQTFSKSYTDKAASIGTYPSSWMPVVVGNQMVACAGHVLRFNGRTWLDNSGLADDSQSYPYPQLRYAYGLDYALQICIDTGNNASAAVLTFDPDADSAKWTSKPASPKTKLTNPSQFGETANWPSAGEGDYLTLGQYLYFRGTATDWADVVDNDPTADVQALVNEEGSSRYIVNSQSLIDQASDFLSYAVYDTDNPGSSSADVIVLKNGQPLGKQAQKLADQKLAVASDYPNDDQPPGTYPGGPSMFASYPASADKFDDATEFYLNRYAGDAIEDNLVHYAVTGLTTGDGFEAAAPTAYLPDPASAACDPSGMVIKYYRSSIYPGTSDPTTPTYGYTVNTYLNGLDADGNNDDNFYDMLDGMLDTATVFDSDNNQVSQTTNGREAYAQRTVYVSETDTETSNLYGAFVCQTSQTKVLDGVSSGTTTGYVPQGSTVPYSGQPITKTATTWGADGKKETIATTMTYGCDLDDDAYRVLHILNKQLQSISTWQPDGGDVVTTRAKATAYQLWPASALGSGVTVPAAEADFFWTGADPAAFPFDSYTPGDQPSGWQRTHRNLARTPHGLVSESEDGCGVARSVSFADEIFPVAQFINASLEGGECAYWGFEPYETNPGSGFTPTGCQPTTDDAHNGAASLSLPSAGSASLAVSVTPQPVEQTYVLGYWSKTPTGFTASSGAGWSIALSFDGQQQPPIVTQFADTSGVWAYQTIGIPITPPAGTQSVTLVATATNTSGDVILLDDVFIAPPKSRLQARTFDPDYHLMTASMDAGGRTTRRIYDNFQRVLASVGPDEQTLELNQRFLSRQGNSDDSFSQASPNAELTLHPAGGGIFEPFRGGDEWATRWTASKQSTNWSVSDGSLQHTQAQSDTLSWSGWTGSTPSTAALFFDVTPQGTLSDGFGITFGDGYQIGYSASGGYSFTDKSGNAVQAPLVTPPAMAEQWLLILGCGVVLFFGDGQLIFSYALSYGSPSAAITTGPNILMFQYLAMLAEPRVGLSYTDAVGRRRQAHQLLGQPDTSTSDARVCQIIFDALNRTVATTRTAPASFGKDSGLPLLSYRPNFVGVGAFLSNISASPASWTMAGDIADYYAGQKDGQIQRSDDEGYPYRGERYEATPLNRVVEQGQPGKNLAIGSENTVQFSYGATSLGQGSSYYKHIVKSPIGTQAISIVDTAGRQVAISIYDPSSDSTAGQMTGQVAYASDATNGAICSLTQKLPNAFTTSPQKDPDNYVSTITQDPRGRVIARQDPSTGTTSYIYSPTGALRFVQPALDPGEAYFIYYCYDALGRIVEEGTLSQNWDPSTLMTNAAQLDWPDSSVAGKTATRTYLYDGDGNDPTKIGLRTQTVTNNPAPSANTTAGDCTVTEAFAYDNAGHVTSVEMDVVLSGSGSQTGTIAYAYDNLGNVTSVTYPAGSPIDQVFYTYDDQGRVSGIGASSGATDIASYTYTMDGEIETETRNNGKLVGVVNYTSPGCVGQVQVAPSASSDPCFEIDYTYNDDSTVQQREHTFNFDGSADTAAFTYQYDDQRRLTDAVAANGGSGDTESIPQYDDNGNIWQAAQNGASLSYTCGPGNDQLQTATMADGTAAAFSYHPDGWLETEKDATTEDSRAIERDVALALTRNITTTTNGTTSNVRFAYGGGGQRTLKQVSGDTSLQRTYFHGNAQPPLALCDDSGWTAFIYGPAGLAAFVAPDKSRYVPLKDIQQTVWAVLDADNSPVGQFDYLPFGTTTSSGTTPSIVAYRFMGQEWDAETGLYNFRARLYDPELRRFISPDAKHQFASPYVFVGDDPLRMVDPSGNISVAAQVGIGLAMFGVTAVGAALSLFTGGASDAAAEAVDSQLLEVSLLSESSEFAGENSTTVPEETLDTLPDRPDPDKWGAFRDAAKAGSNSEKAVSALKSAGTSAMQGGGMSGLLYDITHGRTFSAKGFFESVGIGAAGNAVFSVGFSLLDAASDAAVDSLQASKFVAKGGPAYKLLSIGGRLTASGLASGVSSDFSKLLTNLQQGKPLGQGLGAAFGIGFAQGVVWAGEGEIFGRTCNRPWIALALAKTAGTLGRGVYTVVDNVQWCVGNRVLLASSINGGIFLASFCAALADTYE